MLKINRHHQLVWTFFVLGFITSFAKYFLFLCHVEIKVVRIKVVPHPNVILCLELCVEVGQVIGRNALVPQPSGVEYFVHGLDALPCAPRVTAVLEVQVQTEGKGFICDWLLS